MLNKILFGLSLIIVSLTACNNADVISREEYEDNKTVVIRERDTNSPLILSKKSKTKRLTKAPRYVVSFDKCLGMSFGCNVYPLGSMEDLGYPVIDLEKMSNDYPSYFTSKRIGQSLAESFAYANYDRYTSNSSVTNKVDGGASLNLGLFKMEAKSSMSTIFSISSETQKNRVYGELNIEVRDSAYTMQMSSNIKKRIILNYLSGTFKDELYNTTPSELFTNYGGFVLSNFIVGGRATAVYAGLENSISTSSSKEQSMRTDISASFGFKKGGTSGEFGFGKAYSNGSTSSNKIKYLKTSIRTIGGSAEYGSFSTATSINNLNIDMSGWMGSLNDKSTHSIIDIADNGLVPIADFIMEENLKRRFLQFYTEGVSEITQLQEPYIELASEGNFVLILRVILHTRFGDEILICNKGISPKYPDNPVESIKDWERIEAEFVSRYTSIYKLKCVQQGWLTSPRLRSRNVVQISFEELDESQMQKFTWDNKLYLLYSNGTQKYAYSIHADYLLDTYAIREFVNTLPTAQILPERLFDYTVIAL